MLHCRSSTERRAFRYIKPLVLPSTKHHHSRRSRQLDLRHDSSNQATSLKHRRLAWLPSGSIQNRVNIVRQKEDRIKGNVREGMVDRWTKDVWRWLALHDTIEFMDLCEIEHDKEVKLLPDAHHL
jgi:hypothetical protein